MSNQIARNSLSNYGDASVNEYDVAGPQGTASGVTVGVDYSVSVVTQLDSQLLSYNAPLKIYTINKDGVYNINAFLAWQANAVGDRQIFINVDGSDKSCVTFPASNGQCCQNASWCGYLTAGSLLAVNAVQLSGGVLNIDFGKLTITKLK